MTAAQPHLRPLSRAQCWELLATGEIGRVGITVFGEAPIIVPVNFQVEEDCVVFRSGAGMKLDTARHRHLSFQADDVDPIHHTGWSVLVRGFATIEPNRPASTPPVPWPDPDERRWVVRLWPSHVTGRIIDAGAFDWETRGYL